MRKLIPFVVTMSLLLWWVDVSQTGDKIVCQWHQQLESRYQSHSEVTGAIRADTIFEQANAIFAHGIGRRAS